jgi:hypothetical protein
MLHRNKPDGCGVRRCATIDRFRIVTGRLMIAVYQAVAAVACLGTSGRRATTITISEMHYCRQAPTATPRHDMKPEAC